jgi:hypothetical protein
MKKVDTRDFLDQEMSHCQTQKDLEQDRKKSQLQRMLQRHLEDGVLQKFEIIVESDV